MIICCICPFFGREVIGWVVDMCSVGTAFGYFFTCAGAYILLKKYGDDTDTNKIHPAVAMGGCVISVVILLLDRARFSCIHGSTVLCSTDRVGVDGSYLLFCFKEKFCESH